jgi:hypothetical protein
MVGDDDDWGGGGGGGKPVNGPGSVDGAVPVVSPAPASGFDAGADPFIRVATNAINTMMPATPTTTNASVASDIAVAGTRNLRELIGSARALLTFF